MAPLGCASARALRTQRTQQRSALQPAAPLGCASARALRAQRKQQRSALQPAAPVACAAPYAPRAAPASAAPSAAPSTCAPRRRPLRGGAAAQRRGGTVCAAALSRFLGALLEDVDARAPVQPDAALINADFAPVGSDERTFSTADMAALWIGLVICVPTWVLVGGLVELGFSALQGLSIIGVANTIVLVPMVLNAHAGTKYGVPFPVLARSSFGVRGANVPSLLRALVACGWFGIQTWVGAGAIHTLLNGLSGGALTAPAVAWLGISLPELGCFLLFWAAQVAIIVRGIESIKVVERYSAPVLIGLTLALFAWAVHAAGGVGPTLAAPSAFASGGAKAGRFWAATLPAVTANVGFWATLSLNMPDFSRYAHSQAAQLKGQALGLPVTMVLFSSVALVVTSATAVLFGAPIPDPVALLARIGGVGATGAGLVGLIVATLSTNIAANVVAPANAFVNLMPQRISFRAGGMITAVLGMLVCPWRLVSTTNGFIFVWLVGYSALLGPVAGILLADYWVLRRRVLDVDGLFSLQSSGPYHYAAGYNPAALVALAAGIAPNVPGFLHVAGLLSGVPQLLVRVYEYAWFVGFAVSAAVYLALMAQRRAKVA